MKICNNCNVEIDSGCGKCPYCKGTSFTNIVGYGIADRVNADKARKKKMIIGVIICVIVFLLIIAYAVIRVTYFDPYSAYYRGDIIFPSSDGRPVGYFL